MNIILTPREKEIFHLLVKNYSTKDIASSFLHCLAHTGTSSHFHTYP